MPMSGRDADAAPTPGAQPDVPSSLDDLDDYEVETVILDRQWAREAPVHELSARGRTVQRRLQRPGRRHGRWRLCTPSRWKRFRFWLFRLTRGR